MKHLQINSPEFNHSLLAFKEWLQTLGYSPKTCITYSTQIRELLNYLETQQINSLKQINQHQIQNFTEYIKQRPHTSQSGSISTAHINSILNSLTKFLEYLDKTKGIQLQQAVDINRDKPQTDNITILTQQEINQLLESMDQSQNPVELRDKAIIGLLYGAGLRLSELYNLNLDDISMEQRTVFIRQSKTKAQRLVPLTRYATQTLKTYITEVRDVFTSISTTNEEALFIDIQGKRIPYFTYYNILKNCINRCNIPSIQEKHIRPHVFRHSIATHLCQAGMPIEDIAQFLGHSSLDSTMIYTHLSSITKPTNST